jgi:ADP-heptose:LPS heptosyltransferase
MKLIPNFGRESPVSNSLKLFINSARLVVDTSVALYCALRPNHHHSPSPKKKLLILKVGAIGDVVILSGILPYIRSLHPEEEWEITLLAAGGSQHLANFLQQDVLGPELVFDSFIPINERKFSFNLWYRSQMQIEISKVKYDLVICPTFPRMKDESQILFMAEAKHKIGFGLDNNFLNVKRNNDRLNTHLFEALPGWLKETDRNAHFVKMLGWPKDIDGVPRWQLPTEVVAKAESLIRELDITTPIAAICPGAAYDFRVWPAAKMAVVVDYLWEQHGITSLICGSPAEQVISASIQSQVKSATPICLCGKTNLIDLGGLIAISRLAITMDSGPAHLAVAVNTPLICIIGGGHYKRFFPYGEPEKYRAVTEELECFYCDWNCKFDRPICVENIPIENVLREVDALINSTSSVSP